MNSVLGMTRHHAHELIDDVVSCTRWSQSTLQDGRAGAHGAQLLAEEGPAVHSCWREESTYFWGVATVTLSML